jgi:hypothetical protein
MESTERMTMMSIPTVSEVRDQVLSSARRGEEAARGAIKTAAQKTATAVSSVRNLPEHTHPLAGKLPKTRITTDLPRPSAVIGNARDFAGKMLASERKLAGRVLHAATPPGARKGAEGTRGHAGKPEA